MAASDLLRAAVRQFGFDTADEAAIIQFFNERVTDPTFIPSDTAIRFFVDQNPTVKQIFDRRFSGNAALRQQGKAELTYSEYLETESALKNRLRDSGLPPGFYDDQASLANFIGNEVSAVELADRAQAAYIAVRTEDPALRTELETLYGISEGELAAYYLDPNKAVDAIGRRLTGQDLLRRTQAAQIGSAVRTGAGIQLTAQEAEQLQAQGVSRQEAQQAAEAIGTQRGLLQAQQAGEETITGAEAVGAFAGVNPAAAQRIATRQRRRRAQFEQGGGFAQLNQFLQTGLQTVGE